MFSSLPLLALLVIVALSPFDLVLGASRLNRPAGRRSSRSSGPVSNNNVCQKDVCLKAANRLTTNMNLDVSPCDDFYEFSCGNWIRNNPVPKERVWWSPWAKARVEIKKDVRKLLEQPFNSTVHRFKSAKKILDLYSSCIDVSSREKLGVSPLLQLLERAGGWPVLSPDWDESSYDWERAYIFLRSELNVKYLIDMYVDTDTIDKSRRIIYLDRPSFGVGSNELGVLLDANGSNKLIRAYRKYMEDVINSLNVNGVAKETIRNDLDELFQFIVHLTQIVTPADEKRDHFSVYKRMTLGELESEHPGVNWKFILKNIFRTANVQIDDDEEIIVEDKNYIAKLASVLRRTTPRVVANYFGWRLALHFSDYTSSVYTRLYFEFQRITEGLRVQEQLWEFCYSLVETYYPSVVGRLYIDNYFNTDTVEEVELLIDLIREQVKHQLNTQNWMDQKTKNQAKHKLDNMYATVAYQYWIVNNTYIDFLLKDFKKVNRKQFFKNVLKLQKIEAYKGLEKLRLPVNRLKLINLYGPATVNAYNYFDQNIIQFPAGILQAPFFNLGGPAALNFGAIGKTIGHEIIHAFDDEGKQYDENGSLRDWWTTKTEKKYNSKAKCFIGQYNRYKDNITSLNVNGFNTQGENIADNGGLRMAFRAYKKYVFKYGNGKDPKLPGFLKQFTGDQLFFISFASIWCENETKQSLYNTLVAEAHTPSRFRVIGSVSNLKEFSSAFNCPLGSPMNPKKKCQLW